VRLLWKSGGETGENGKKKRDGTGLINTSLPNIAKDGIKTSLA
jgi:hypothetical protein